MLQVKVKGPRYWPVEFQADTNWPKLRWSVTTFWFNANSAWSVATLSTFENK